MYRWGQKKKKLIHFNRKEDVTAKEKNYLLPVAGNRQMSVLHGMLWYKK